MAIRSTVFATICFILIVSMGVVYAEGHKFIGAGACKMCHKGAAKGSQFETWEGSKHAKAMESLKSEAALKVAKDKGLKAAPSETAECVGCHQTAFGVDAALLDAKFDKNLGVQCESCHGAGGDYKTLTVMKDRAKSIQMGMNPILASDGTAEKLCRTCHNEKSPFFKGFNFQESWAKIKHPRPKA